MIEDIGHAFPPKNQGKALFWKWNYSLMKFAISLLSISLCAFVTCMVS